MSNPPVLGVGLDRVMLGVTNHWHVTGPSNHPVYKFNKCLLRHSPNTTRCLLVMVIIVFVNLCGTLAISCPLTTPYAERTNMCRITRNVSIGSLLVCIVAIASTVVPFVIADAVVRVNCPPLTRYFRQDAPGPHTSWTYFRREVYFGTEFDVEPMPTSVGAKMDPQILSSRV